MAWNFDPSRERICATVAKVETTYGTDSTPAGGTDDVLAINSPNIVGFEASTFPFRPHGSSFTHRKDIIGARWQPVNLTFLLQGSGTAGDKVVNGFSGQSALLRSAGLKETVSAGVSIVYTPAAIADIASATLKTDPGGGVTKAVTGLMGNIVFAGNPEAGVECRYSGLGLYNAPVMSALTGWTGGTNRAQPCYNISGSITPSGGSAYTGVMDSFEWDLGIRVERIRDMNSATGMKRTLFVDRAPTLRLTLATDLSTTDNNLQYDDIFGYLVNSTTHDLAWTLGDGAGAGMEAAFAFNDAQLIRISEGSQNGYRTIQLQYKLQNATNEAEFTLTFT